MRYLAAIALFLSGACTPDECEKLAGNETIMSRIEGVGVQSGTPLQDIECEASLIAVRTTSSHDNGIEEHHACEGSSELIAGDVVVSGTGIEPVTLLAVGPSAYGGTVPYTTDLRMTFTERDSGEVHEWLYPAPALFQVTVNRDGGNLIGTMSAPPGAGERDVISVFDCTVPQYLVDARPNEDSTSFVSSMINYDHSYRAVVSRGGQGLSISVYADYISPTGGACTP